MSDGFGAAFFALSLFAVLLAVAGLLVATAVVARYRRGGTVARSVRYVAVGAVAVVVAVAGFGVAVLAGDATRLSALFGTVVFVPLALVAGRARWAGATWTTSVAMAGMAWSLPFLGGVVLLFVLQVHTDVSTTAMTGVAGIVTGGGALLVGEYVGSTSPDPSSPDRG